jgi:hypothetical protein
MNIATALLQAIKERGLDTLFEIEEAASKQTKAAILAALKGQTADAEGQTHQAKPTAEDQMRLAVIYYLSLPDGQLSKDDLKELTELLTEAGADVKALDYVKKVREVNRMTVMATQPAVAAPSQGADWSRGFGALGSRVSLHISSRYLLPLMTRSPIVCAKAVFRPSTSTISFPASRTSYLRAKSSPSRGLLRRSWSRRRLAIKPWPIRTNTSSLTLEPRAAGRPPLVRARAGSSMLKAWSLSLGEVGM